MYYDQDKIKFIDNLSVQHFNNRFSIEKYNVFRRFQLRCKLYTTRRFKAANVIHEHIHNLIYFAKCGDLTVGIVPRLEWQKLCEDNENITN